MEPGVAVFAVHVNTLLDVDYFLGGPELGYGVNPIASYHIPIYELFLRR